ncbi:MAG: sigma-70 family RNA polymerase sigma factor [Calditrichaeota bacterium]|nr:MAG: sigma-70 family RNA polymerase sigma factor [Calditrichota bacterium]
MLKRFLLSDKEIVRRVRENDRTLLGQLYIHYSPAIVRFVKNHGGSQSDAEDVMQEAIIVLWKRIVADTLEPRARISTFLFAVAKNIWFNETRRRKRHAIPGTDQEAHADSTPDALETVLSTEQQQQVHRALNALQKVCRDLLLLFYFEKRSMSEIAAHLNFANSNTAKAKKYQCLKKLKEQMSHAH